MKKGKLFKQKYPYKAMKKTGILVIITLLLILPLVSSQSFNFRQGDDVNFRFRCIDRDANSYCNISTQVIFSIEDPFGANAINNISGTTQDTFVNITLPTDKLGTYSVFGFSPNNVNTTIELKYKVTFTGEDENAFPIQLSIIILGMIGIGVSYTNTRLRLMRIGGSAIMLTMGVLTIYPGWGGLSFENLLGLLVGTVSIAIGAYYAVEDFFVREQREFFDYLDNER